MKEFQVKTSRTPEGAERRAEKTFEWAVEKYAEDMELDGDRIIGNTINDKENGVKISLVPCYDKHGVAREGLAILDVEEYSSSKNQKHQMPTAKTTFLFDEQGNVCEMCYSDERKFSEDPVYMIYDDQRVDKNIVSKFEEANTPINASFLDSLALANNIYEYDPNVILEDIEDIAMPTLFKSYMHQRLDQYTDSGEIADSCDGLPLGDLKLVVDKVAEMDEDELIALADEENER